MKITRLSLNHVRMQLKSPFETSFGRIETRDSIIIRAYTDDLVGLGECVADQHPGYSYETSATAWQIIKDYLAPALIGSQINDLPELHHRMEFVRGHPMAKAGLEMACWDLLSKQRSIPLSTALGGIRTRVEVGVSIGIQDSVGELLHTVSGYIDHGYQRIKIKIKPGKDIHQTQAVRRSFPQTPLQVDANSAYTLETASPIRQLDDLDLLLIEQPLAEDDMWDHHYLQKELKTPICLDESILSPRHARQAIDMQACKVVNIKAGRVGGLAPAVKIHDICLQHGIPVWCGGMLETGIGRAANLALASLPNFTQPGDISATDRYYQEDITQERFILNPDSTIDVPLKPGLGIELDHKALKKATLYETVIQ